MRQKAEKIRQEVQVELAAQDAAMPLDVLMEESSGNNAQSEMKPALAGGAANADAGAGGINVKDGQSPEKAIRKAIQSRSKTAEEGGRDEEAAKQKAAKQMQKLLKAKQERAERAKQVRHEMKAQVIESRLREVRAFLVILRKMAQTAMPALPDIFVWVLSGEKRVAYARIPARDVLYSEHASFTGNYCNKIQTLFMRVRSVLLKTNKNYIILVTLCSTMKTIVQCTLLYYMYICCESMLGRAEAGPRESRPTRLVDRLPGEHVRAYSISLRFSKVEWHIRDAAER